MITTDKLIQLLTKNTDLAEDVGMEKTNTLQAASKKDSLTTDNQMGSAVKSIQTVPFSRACGVMAGDMAQAPK